MLNEINKEKMNREVYCLRDKIYSYSDEADPICPTCKGRLVTVVYHPISGHKITGNDSQKEGEE